MRESYIICIGYFCPEMGKKNTLKIEIRKNVHILKTRSNGRCRCGAECKKLLCHSTTKTLSAIVLFYTFSISLTFFNQKFIQVRNKESSVSLVCCYFYDSCYFCDCCTLHSTLALAVLSP